MLSKVPDKKAMIVIEEAMSPGTMTASKAGLGWLGQAVVVWA